MTKEHFQKALDDVSQYAKWDEKERQRKIQEKERPIISRGQIDNLLEGWKGCIKQQEQWRTIYPPAYEAIVIYRKVIQDLERLLEGCERSG